MRRLIVLAIICAVPSALLAQEAAPAPAAKPAKEKKICRSEEATGSIMVKRVCHTKDEWAAIDKANDTATDQFGTARRVGHWRESQTGSPQ